MVLGSHLSIAKGYTKAVEEAIYIGANTFQFFTRNPRGGKAKELNLKDIDEAAELMKEYNFGQLLAHAPYTMNLCSEKEEVVSFSKYMMKDDLERLKNLPCNLYNFHPGSHVGTGVDKGIEKITKALNEIISGEETVLILLETMSGKGTEIGKTFEEIKMIVDGVKHTESMGVCLDTCHVYSAGYDIVNDLDGVIEEFDKIIGLDYLKAIHLNDSKTPFNSFKDRHEKLGLGTIGEKTLIEIVNHPKLKNIPFFLETPNESEGYKYEIDVLRRNENG